MRERKWCYFSSLLWHESQVIAYCKLAPNHSGNNKRKENKNILPKNVLSCNCINKKITGRLRPKTINQHKSARKQQATKCVLEFISLCKFTCPKNSLIPVINIRFEVATLLFPRSEIITARNLNTLIKTFRKKTLSIKRLS